MEYFGSPAWEYALGYKTAAEWPIDGFGAGYPYYWETHVYPICFLYRQAVEVALKDLLTITCDVLDVPTNQPPVKTTLTKHRLTPVWELFLEYSERIQAGATRGELNDAVTERTAEFDQIDPMSYTFRYATDPDRTRINLKRGWTVDLDNLRQVMDCVWALLGGCLTWADEYRQLKHQLEAEYADYR